MNSKKLLQVLLAIAIISMSQLATASVTNGQSNTVTIPSAYSPLAATMIPVSLDDAGAHTLAGFMVTDPQTLISAEFVSPPPDLTGYPHVVADALSFFPTDTTGFGILTTGSAFLADSENTSGSTGQNLGGASILDVRGDTAYDISVLKITFDAPDSASDSCRRWP